MKKKERKKVEYVVCWVMIILMEKMKVGKGDKKGQGRWTSLAVLSKVVRESLEEVMTSRSPRAGEPCRDFRKECPRKRDCQM